MLLLALLLGLRHATDPDHLTAVATLAISEDGAGRRTAALGLAWGLGHATTLVALGLPFVLVGPVLPESFHRGIEAAVGLLIVALAARLLVRWWRGALHSHPHAHGDRVHAHPHAHGHAHDVGAAPAPHAHAHVEALGRTPRAAFGVGLLHGAGGSAAAGVLVVAGTQSSTEALGALLLFAAGAAISMAAASLAFGLTVGRTARRFEALVPLLAVAGIAIGAAHALGAL